MSQPTVYAAPDYEQRRRDFDWGIAERELGYRPGDPINIGWYCSDRVCQLGQGHRLALLWEDFQGRCRFYSFDDLRLLSNTFAAFLLDLGLVPGERVCLFHDRVPELDLGFVGALKMGGIVQPLISPFREDSLATRLKTRRPRWSSPSASTILGYVAGRSDHPSARQIHRGLSSRLPRPSLATVYNTLTALVELGLIREVNFEATDNRYDTNLAPHINLVCVRCGSISDVDHDLPVPPAAIRSELGFEAVDFRIEYRGLCAKCRVSRSTEPGVRR